MPPPPAQLMDGAAVARTLLEDVAARAAAVLAARGRPPRLATVLVGDDPASHTYVRMKVNRSRKAGIDSVRHDLPATTSTREAVEVVAQLSADPTVDGILVQHPMPMQVDERAVFDAIDPAKDVDGVTATSFLGMAESGTRIPRGSGYPSCTPAGILALLDAYQVQLSGVDAVVVGRSQILGKPAALLLLARDATVTVAHSRTERLDRLIGTADLLIAAVGRPELIRADWVKPGAVVIDAGYNAGNVGDVQPSAADRARLITPVPGGVGPLTIATLLAQTVDAAERHR